MKLNPLCALAWSGTLLSPVTAPAQEADPGRTQLEWTSLVLDESGERVSPTPATALRELRSTEGEALHGVAPSAAVLTQLFEPRSLGELDAFAETIVGLALSDDRRLERRAVSVLQRSANAEEGIPYHGAFNALRRVYETRVRDVPANGQGDPFRYLESTSGLDAGLAAINALYALYQAEPDGRGGDYLLEVIESLDPPAEAGASTWCQANEMIFFRHRDRLKETRDEALRALPVDTETYVRFCHSGDELLPPRVPHIPVLSADTSGHEAPPDQRGGSPADPTRTRPGER